MAALLTVLEANPVPLSAKEIALALPARIPDTRFKRALKALVSDGTVDRQGSTKGARYLVRNLDNGD
jgi:DNA-binding IclR family transcriptional regulator